MISPTRLLSCAALLILCQVSSLVLFGAEPSQSIISARIKCLSMDGEVDGIEFLLEQGRRLPVKAASTYISQTYDYNGPALLTIVRARPKAATSGDARPASMPAPKPEILASVQMPPTGGDFLLLFSNNQATLHILAVPFSSADVPIGSCLVWNVTPRALGVSLGGQRAVLDTGQRKTLTPETSPQNYFDLRVFDEHEGHARPLVGGPHFLQEKTRQLIFIAERTPGQAAVAVKVVEELPEVESGRRIQAAGLQQTARKVASN